MVTRYQLGLVRQAGSLTTPPSAFRPHGTWVDEGGHLRAHVAGERRGEFGLVEQQEAVYGRQVGGTGAPGGGSLISDETDSPLSSAKAVT